MLSESLSGRTGCLNWARPGLWGLREGNLPVLPGELRKIEQNTFGALSILRKGVPPFYLPVKTFVIFLIAILPLRFKTVLITTGLSFS